MPFDLSTAKPAGFDLLTATQADDRLETDPLSLIPGQDSPPAQDVETSFGDDVIGAGETALSMATGATGGVFGQFVGTMKGIADEVMSGEFGTSEAADRIEKKAMAMGGLLTFTPRTEAGRKQIEAIGDVLGQAVPLAGLTGEMTAIARMAKLPVRKGTRLIDKQGKPTLALEKALDKKGLVFDSLAPEAKAVIPEVAGRPLKGTAMDVVREQIKTGATDDSLAVLRVVGDKVKADPLGIEAVRQGFEPGFVSAVKAANPETKAGMKNMLGIMRQIKTNRRRALDTRMTDVTGDAFTSRINFIRDKANEARIDLNKIARVELHGKDINTGPVVQRLTEALDDLDINLVDLSSGKPRPIFKGSMISKDRGSQRVITDLIDLMAEGGKPDALRFHKLKRQLDNMIDFKKKSAGGLSDAGRNVLKNIRSALNESIREVSPRYAKVNDTLSSSLTALDDFQRVSGSLVDVFGPNANKAVGQELRGIMSNRKSRVKLENAVDQMNAVASDLGGVFPDDIKSLAMFANMIEDRFGAVAQTSFKGEIESAIKATGQLGIKATAFQQGIGKVASGAEKLRGVNDFNAFKAMQDILNQR